MTKIIIGREYADAFQSICTLVEGGCVDKKIVREIRKGASGASIITDTYEFEYSDDELLGAQEDSSALEFGADGATWFAPLRGEKREDGIAEWLSLIEQVAGSYHWKYSFIEYRQTARKVTDEERAQCISALNKIIALFFKNTVALQSVEVTEGDSEDGAEDIYCVSLRTELSGGSGAAVPVLGKVYFRKRGGKFYAIEDEEADGIDQAIYAKMTSGTADAEQTENYAESGVIDSVLGALNDLLYTDEGRGFTDSLCFGAKEDERIVQELLEQGSHDNMRLECSAVKVLGISHVRWINSSYVVRAGGSKLLRATVGFNNTLSLYCMNCNGTPLIENNRIVYPKKDGEGKTVGKKVAYIDFAAQNLGLSPEQIVDILADGAFAEHLLSPCTHLAGARGVCKRTVCVADMENLGTPEQPIMKCKDCPYPEVVFSDGQLRRRYTPDLAFARDLMTLTDRAQVATCSCCGRGFTKKSLKNGLCDFCRSALQAKGEAEEKAKQCYQQYAHVFSPLFRLRNAGKVKLCFEEADLLLFRIGDGAYVLHKTDIEEEGYISYPKKTYL